MNYEETVSFLKNNHPTFKPEVAIVLGSGLGNLLNKVEVLHSLPYKEIPHFCDSTAQGHEGTLIFGTLNGVNIIGMKGRYHFYEGYSAKQITYPVRIFNLLGVKKIILSNAAGGIHPSHNPGDIMMISDHINLLGENPLIGPNENDFGTRFPDMSNAYDADWRKKVQEIASKKSIKLHEGVYLASKGPTFETAAEIEMMKLMGADAAGMSTVPEVIVARHSGMKVLAFSCITNLATGVTKEAHSLEDVYKKANQASDHMSELVSEVLPYLD
jgi:purine-nucleoside phosphorylase